MAGGCFSAGQRHHRPMCMKSLRWSNDISIGAAKAGTRQAYLDVGVLHVLPDRDLLVGRFEGVLEQVALPIEGLEQQAAQLGKDRQQFNVILRPFPVGHKVDPANLHYVRGSFAPSGIPP